MQMAIVQYVLAVYRKVSLCIGFRLITSLRVDCQWADAKCRVAKRQTRQRERAYTSVCRRLNRALLHNSTSSESTDAATARVAAAKMTARCLVTVLYGCGVPINPSYILFLERCATKLR